MRSGSSLNAWGEAPAVAASELKAQKILDERQKSLRDDAVVEPVAAGEDARHAGVVLFEDCTRFGLNQVVAVAEKPVAESPVVVGYAVELAGFKLLEMRNRLLGDVELRRAVLAAVQPLVLADVEDVVFLRDPERRVHADADEAMEHLGVHAAHGGADDDVGYLVVGEGLHGGHGLKGIWRDVGRHDDGPVRGILAPKRLSQELHRAARPRRAESMQIQNLLHMSALYQKSAL